MIVINHCGLNNTIYQTSHLPIPYASVPSHSDSNIAVNFVLEEVDFNPVCTHGDKYIIKAQGDEPELITLNKPQGLVQVSHIVVITDKL
jgi:hypothetical protein